MTVTTLDYIRHGQPAGGSKYRGHRIDDPLSETGWSQMRDTTATLSGWTQVVSSPMLRCRAFAEWIAGQRQLPLLIVDELREIGFGSWEGATREQLLRERAEEYHAFYRDPVNCRPAGAESLHDFGQRVANAFGILCRQHAGGHLLVVAHAGVIRATLGHVLQTPAANWYQAAINNAALSRFTHEPQGNKLIAHNWRPALDGA